MACKLLVVVAVAWVTTASAEHYIDYTGVKMPHYSSNEYETGRDTDTEHDAAFADDYHGHSPDASASLDYKYQNQPYGKSVNPVIESDDAVNWNKPSRRYRELLQPPDDNKLDTTDKYDLESDTDTGFKAKKRFKHRSRYKNSNLHNYHEPSNLWSSKNVRKKNYDNNDYNDDFDEDSQAEIQDNKRIGLNERSEHYRHHETTERVIRRKQRDRFNKKLIPNREITNDDIDLDRRRKANKRIDLDYMSDKNRRRKPHRSHSDDEEEREGLGEREQQKLKTNENYGDYYDMKRVHNIKNKLPTLLRRPTAIMDTSDTTVAAIPDLIEALWTHRRANVRTSSPSISVDNHTSSATRTSTSQLFATRTLQIISTNEVLKDVSHELSLAEKSRLSILKKAQRKEGINNDVSTKKPPVLMQVTNKTNTIVLVEPPTSSMPWMRASVIVDDTPERLDRAKKLMRYKIVSRAKNIQELTDNWDEVICDYIDVALLDATSQTCRLYVLILIQILLFCSLYFLN